MHKNALLSVYFLHKTTIYFIITQKRNAKYWFLPCKSIIIKEISLHYSVSHSYSSFVFQFLFSFNAYNTITSYDDEDDDEKKNEKCIIQFNDSIRKIYKKIFICVAFTPPLSFRLSYYWTNKMYATQKSTKSCADYILALQ